LYGEGDLGTISNLAYLETLCAEAGLTEKVASVRTWREKCETLFLRIEKGQERNSVGN
jgi:hypothetical protein